jgi:lipoprotein-releasing system permease protein
MNLKLIFDVAMSLLFARWKQTLVAAIGVTFSITMFIALLSFMSGLNELLDGLILNRTPHIRLYNEVKQSEHQPVALYSKDSQQYNFISSVKPSNEKPQIHNSGAIIDAIKKDGRVSGVAPKVVVQVFYNIGTINLTGLINGIDVLAENRLFSFQDYVVAGDYTDLQNVPNSIILGIGAAETMLVDLGDVIQVTTVRGDHVQLKVVGFFQSGILDIDKVQSYTSLATAQKILGEANSYITDIQVKLHDLLLAPAMAKEYNHLFSVEATDIQTANSQFETGSFIRTLISYAVGVTLLIVAGFGIYNILNMMIYEKMDSIAILKATGFSGGDVRWVFVTIALTIGVFGGLLGLVFGLGLSAIIGQVPFETASLPTVKTYPINYSPTFYFIGGVFSLVTTYLAGYFPARKASQIDPVIIIRGK